MNQPAPSLFEIPVAANQNSARLDPAPTSAEFQFERPDWVLFRSIGTLSQKAGVPTNLLRRLVLKEIVDNALDAGGKATIEADGDTYVIEDDGPGLDGSPDDIARMFSINRPMVSSKLWRLPKRGALGNGLRVVAGAVLASGGELVVTTRGMEHVLTPMDDGTTSVESTPSDLVRGTRVVITLGPDLPADPLATKWALGAIRMAEGEHYSGTPSPFWYDADHFFELLQAAGERPVRELVSQLDGCTGARAGQVTEAFRGMPCHVLDRDQAVALLGAARAHAKPVSARRLGSVGKCSALPECYAMENGTVQIGARNPKAEIPFVVEAWCEFMASAEDTVAVAAFVNRTPIAGEVRPYKDKRKILIYGCGLAHHFEGERGSYNITLSIIAPHIPITTDGKEPDLSPFVKEIASAIQAAIKKAKRAAPKTKIRRSQKEAILANLADGIEKNSDGGRIPFPCRNLYYSIRTPVLNELGGKLDYGYFQAVLTEYENENGYIKGLNRDPRGTLYHPHTGESISVGTQSVERYDRPKWTFENLLFIEKEGFFEALKAAKWPERYDCALLTSKGFSTRAVRDLIDMLAADTDEPLRVFCIHDSDAEGSMIFQTLQEATRARERRKIEIINLGLEPWEAVQMGLQVEEREKTKKEIPVGDYIKNRIDGNDWAAWLQRNRFELNAMTMPQFISWLNAKMAEHGVRKVLPPVTVARERIMKEAEATIRAAIQEKLLEAAGLEKLVAHAVDTLAPPADVNIEEMMSGHLEHFPTEPWTKWAAETGKSLAA